MESLMNHLFNFKESVVVECKLALGRDGNGAIPNDFWETYSAFANTHGGTIYLGVKEKDGEFSVQGIPNPERLKTDLFSTLNNPKKVSCNLLSDKDVIIEEIDDKKILVIKIPQASRQQRPVYINENFFTGTFRRLHDGDRKCSEESVKRMLAEQTEDSRDSKILQNYTLDDFHHETIDAYRQMFANYKPDHPWNVPNKLEFLRLSGCWRRERATGEEGFTLAGVLMFGTWNAIMDICPFLFWDYQELSENVSTDHRWIDRIVFDGTWSGNLFDFYRKVSLKLLSDLKKPFRLKDGIRQDDTVQHKALREALINTLVHADYSGRASIKIQKSPNGYMFRNPGVLRLPKKNIMIGGESDCRNRTIHQLFLMLGLGERAGSGLPKIKEAWEALGYEVSLEDDFEPYEQTILTLKKNPNFKLNEPVN
jgi:ATP-dependent DNA helicase RecG